MDTGAIRPLPSFTVYPAPRVAESTHAVSETDLPEEATVRQTSEPTESRSSESRFQQDADSSHQIHTTSDLDRRVEQDPSTESFVYKAIDTESGEVVTQIPTDSLLKMRAYVQAQSAEWTEHHRQDDDHAQDMVDRTA